MPAHFVGHEFEALKLRYEDQVALLRSLTEIDHRIFTAFFALQLALGGWLATQAAVAERVQWGLASIDFTLAALSVKLLFNNHCRRQEVAATISNLNEALGFNAIGSYLLDRALNPEYKRRYWFKWYVVGVVAAYFGLMLVLMR